jgi:hypothetical protein
MSKVLGMSAKRSLHEAEAWATRERSGVGLGNGLAKDYSQPHIIISTSCYSLLVTEAYESTAVY